MRCGTVAVGIGNYASAALNADDVRLRYAVEDAASFHRYAALAWPANATRSIHLQLLDREASLPGIRAAFEALANVGPFDFVAVYLSGHGQRHSDGSGWFCASDATLGDPSLSGAILDELLHSLPATSTLLLMDCCYAEAVTSGTSFFSSLAEARARLFCVSARAGERAWEDDRLKRSIFSHALFLGLSSHSELGDRTGAVDVEARLLPYLREQTPLLAADLKRGAIQQPVCGGQSAAALTLPTVATQSIGRATSIVDVLRLQARRILVSIGIGVVAGLALTELLFTHLAVSADQRILVRPGIASTYSALPWHLARETDTGFRITQLDLTREVDLQRLANGGFRSISTWRTVDGMYVWIDQLRPLFKSPSVLRFLERPAPIRATRDASEPAPIGFESINFAARVIGQSPLEYARRTELVLHSPVLDVDCASIAGPATEYDFAVSGSAPIVDFVRAFVRYGLPQSTDRGADLWKLARFVSARALLRQFDAVAFAEMDALLSESARIAPTIHVLGATKDSMAAELSATPPTSCSLLVVPLAAMIEPLPLRSEAEAALRGQPGGLTAAAMVALRKRGVAFDRLLKIIPRDLTLVAAAHPLDALSQQAVAESLLSEIDPALEPVADQCGLAPNILKPMLRLLTVTADDSKQLAAFRALSRAFRCLAPDEQQTVVQWTESQLLPNRMVTDFVVSAGLVGRYHALSPAALKVLLERLTPSARYEPGALQDFGGSVIETNADPVVAALAMASPTSKLNQTTIHLLEDVLAHRPELAYRSDAVAGLAKDWVESEGLSSNSITRRLRSERSSAAARKFTVELAVVALDETDEPVRRQTLGMLAIEWHMESDPEIRASVGEIVARAR